MKKMLFILIFFLLASIPSAKAFGECSQYGVMAQYNSYNSTCTCVTGWVFQNTYLGKQCVSTSEYCRNSIGLMSTYNSLYDRCECMSGYVLKTDSLGNPSCVSGASACRDQLGIYSSYQSFSDKCVCDLGYTIVGGKCVDLDEQCTEQLGFHSTYDSLYDTCKCNSGYVINNGKCSDASSVCTSEIGFNSSYNSITKKCECDTGYTLDASNQCVEKQNNVYFKLIELDGDNREAVIKSDYDNYYYHIGYNSGCYSNSFERYLNKEIVINLGTDFDLDTYDKIVLQDDDETCDITSKEKVDSDFTMFEKQDTSTGYYVPVPGNIFQQDIANSPYSLSIMLLKQRGIISGYPDGTFGPKYQINRAEFMKIILGAVSIPGSGDNCYSDVNGDWFAGWVCAAKKLDIASGYPDGTFKPGNYINVAEALKITLKAFGITVRESNRGEEWFAPYIEMANNENIYLPTFDSPNKKVTREEMAELIQRLLNK